MWAVAMVRPNVGWVLCFRARHRASRGYAEAWCVVDRGLGANVVCCFSQEVPGWVYAGVGALQGADSQLGGYTLVGSCSLDL